MITQFLTQWFKLFPNLLQWYFVFPFCYSKIHLKFTSNCFQFVSNLLQVRFNCASKFTLFLTFFNNLFQFFVKLVPNFVSKKKNLIKNETKFGDSLSVYGPWSLNLTLQTYNYQYNLLFYGNQYFNFLFLIIAHLVIYTRKTSIQYKNLLK